MLLYPFFAAVLSEDTRVATSLLFRYRVQRQAQYGPISDDLDRRSV